MATQPNTYILTVTVTETYGGYDSFVPNNTPSIFDWGGGLLGSRHKQLYQQISQTDTDVVDVSITVIQAVEPISFFITPSNTSICVGETVYLTFSSSGGTGAITYSLVNAVEGVIIGNTAAIFEPNVAGTYTLTFTAHDSLGNASVDNQTVTIKVAEAIGATARLSKNPIQIDETVTITLIATGGIGSSTFSTSSTGVSLVSTSNNTATATFISSESGIFSLSFIATDVQGHTATANVSVIVEGSDEPEPEDEFEPVEPTHEDTILPIVE